MRITTIDDYVEDVAAEFPELSEADVKRILTYGWKMILQYVSAGNDVMIKNRQIFFFIGKLYKDALRNFRNYVSKLSKRIAYMFRRTSSRWDGHYYFALTDKQYAEYCKQKKGKYKTFKKVWVYKLLEEIKVREFGKRYIFRVDEDLTKWRIRYYPELKTRFATLIIRRDPLKMKDILTSQNKFKYIQYY